MKGKELWTWILSSCLSPAVSPALFSAVRFIQELSEKMGKKGQFEMREKLNSSSPIF
jgi:hypothetical protein